MSASVELDRRLREIHALSKVADVLEWDQQVCMPKGGAAARAEQYALIKRLAHERFTDPELGRLLDAAEDTPLRRVARRDYDLKRKLPVELVEALARKTAEGQEIWAEARAKSDFALFRPALEEIVALKRRQAEALGGGEDPYDAWLAEFEPGMSTADLDALFASLKAGLVPLVKEIAARADRVDDSVLHRRFPIAAQRAFGEECARAIGYDFDRGRQDLAVHPFSLSFSTGDARITTRYQEDFLPSGLFGTLHEAGHAMYEQGVSPELEGSILCNGATMGLHESQSRLWENVVGRSRGFWRRFWPRLRETFPEPLRGVDEESFYRAINKAGPSLIRVEADELTYSLHILLRFELERELLSGKVAPKDLPEAWNAKSRAFLGLTPPDDARGVLQDVHWSAGLLGYFPTYALGNVIALQLYDAALKAPGVKAAVEAADYAPLLAWLREHVHRHGRAVTAPEVVGRACGGPIDAGPYLAYLRSKFGPLYCL